MFIFISLVLLIAISNAYDNILLNDFSADVDIYDMGKMGRGKNACSWHRSKTKKHEIFYYLAMQPWRHLEWTDCTGSECYKFFINEDASTVPDGKTKLKNEPANDYCRKEYANPMATFDIDWNQIDQNSRLEAVDINGRTCYKYPAQQPLAHIYLQQQYMRERDVTVMTPCRYDFIGGKSITFRSFNVFSEVFITTDKANGYLGNKTRCNIDPTDNNVDTDFAIILGISDTNVVQTINGALGKLSDLKTVKQVTVYYLSGESLKKETIALKNLATLKSKQIAVGPVDALINTAKNDLVKRINAKAIYRGTIIALMDRTLSSTFDAETAFDRNNITVHTIIYNPKNDNQMRVRARSLLSVGDHYHEFTSSQAATKAVDELYIGIRTNLTERCNRTSCDGFCDGRDRCTCPMCCENTCFFSYCNATTATCKAWPEAAPKKKIECKNDCVGTQECKDLQGCVYTEYNADCAPRAKCMKPYCDDANKCAQESSCETDKTPSFENKCWNYTCNEQNGNCERDKSGAACPKLPDLCHEYVCNSKTLACTYQKKTCVKTAPYVEMSCYKAECNKRTGVCENVLNCGGALASYTGCGGSATTALCKCDAKTFACSCTGSEADAKKKGYCSGDEICDMSDESKGPTCKVSNCHQDLFKEGCQIKTCNEETSEIEWKEYDCTKNVTITYAKNEALNIEAKTVESYCKDKFEIICYEGACSAQEKEGVDMYAACGSCKISEPVVSTDKYHKTYTVTYTEDCSYLALKCPNGEAIPYQNELFPEINGKLAVTKCDANTHQCVFNYKDTIDFTNFNHSKHCSPCYSTAFCYKADKFRTYHFDKETGTCSMEVNYDEQPKCSVCNENKDGFVKTCDNLKLEKTWKTTINGTEMTFKYNIPRLCYPGDQCVPDPNFDCTNTNNGDIGKIYELLATCADEFGVQSQYHYSKFWDYNRYSEGRGQSEEFLKDMNNSAYCTWSFNVDKCKYCTVSGSGNQYTTKMNDKCDDMIKEFKQQNLDHAFTFKCNRELDECEATLVETNCNPEKCYYYVQNQQTGQCYNSTIGTCGVHYEAVADKKAHFKTRYEETTKILVANGSLANNLKDKYPQIECKYTIDCNKTDNITCHYDEFHGECVNAYNDYISGKRDFGCRKPVADCNFTDLHCSFIELNKTNPAEDVRFFYERDNVVFNNLCYQYECKEYINETTGLLEHHWVQTEASLAELNKAPETICDTVKCNKETGKSESERRQCNPVEDYGLSESMAMCFECACSMMTGENVLTMRPDTAEATYELDACGNCVVKDRKTGQQTNEVIPCVLAQPVNLTGAIAGATVAASVVFGLIGSMVVVSIGAFQTYQLVSSAMKNVISTTLENPEFVAADNEATNVLNNE